MKTNLTTKIKVLLFFCLNAICMSCDKYIQIDPPIDQISKELVFDTDDAAKSAIVGLYSRMITNGSCYSGDITSIASVTGMCSDELIAYNSAYTNYFTNSLSPASSGSSQWTLSYQLIYTTNAVIEGLAQSRKISEDVKRQLLGEAKFVRAFCYFYLTNLYGAIPLHLTTDYRINNTAIKSSQSEVYEQIISDLREADENLSNAYYTTERIRPNKFAAKALLARTYLYAQKYEEAELLSGTIIENTAVYSLKDDLNQVFLKNSTEAIWQLIPNSVGRNTWEANLFILTAAPSSVSITPTLVGGFEPLDKRKTLWIGSITVGDKTFYYPYKYKIGNVSTISEYSMVLRLAEQYLIRAEARINQGKIESGIQDLNTLRQRARPTATPDNPNPLPDLPANLSKAEALAKVEQERRIELFSEWGHRWFDLKRTNRADAILRVLKGSSWQETDILFPIPQAEINANSLIIQNEGY